KHGPYPTLGNNLPLRGWKGDLYEGGIRVPAFVHWPTRLKPRLLTQTVGYLDWFPTMAKLAEAMVDPAWKLEGRDLWPLLAGEKKPVPTPTLYWNIGQADAVLAGDWKLIVSRKKNGTVELYNLKDDPQEKENLAEMNSAMVTDLRKILEEQKKLDPASRK